MANLWDRVSLIVRSKANAWMDGLEDPAQVIDQVIIDAKSDYAKCKKESGPVLANERKAKEDLEDYQKQLDKWNRIAEAAVSKGEDGDAEKALQHVVEYEEKVAAQETRVAEATQQADSLRAKLNKMADQIKDMEGKAAAIKADSANAKAARTTAKVGSKIGSNSFAQFDRLAEKAANDRREAEALAEFEDDPAGSADADLEKKYAGAGSTPVSDRLAALKAKMGK